MDQGNPACLKLDAAVCDGQAPDYGPEYLELLGNSPHLLHVIEVKATNTWVTNDAVKALVTSPHLRTYLRRLDLTCGYTTSGEEDYEPNDEAVEAVAGSPRMAYLRELVLDDYWSISDRGAAALAASPHLWCLTRLVVAGTSDSGMTKTGEQVLQSRFGDRVVVHWLW